MPWLNYQLLYGKTSLTLIVVAQVTYKNFMKFTIILWHMQYIRWWILKEFRGFFLAAGFAPAR